MDLTTEPVLRVENLGCGYGRTRVLHNVTLPPVRAGEVTAVIGPNAAGKSTLLRGIAGLHRADGTVRVDGGHPHRTGGGILYLPQDPPPPSSITVFEAVLLARRLGRGGGGDAEAQVATTLVELRLDHLPTRRLSDLSGGQRQLVSLAQAVTRRPDALLLDEPTSSLDLSNQLRVLRFVRDLARRQPAAVLTVIHDLALAARIADQVVVLRDGATYAHGTPAEVITPEMLRDVYRVAATVHTPADGGLTVSVTDSL